MNYRPVTASAANKLVAKHAAIAFGGTPHVVEYCHDHLDLTIGVLSCRDRPEQGVTAYSTIKLSDFPMLDGATEFPTRLELCMAISSEYSCAPNILATIAMIIIRTRRLCFPGSVFENAVKEYDPSTNCPHILLTSPFLWENTLRILPLPTGNVVAWLLAAPISQAEMEFLSIRGLDALEALFETEQVDFLNPHRKSLI